MQNENAEPLAQDLRILRRRQQSIKLIVGKFVLSHEGLVIAQVAHP